MAGILIGVVLLLAVAGILAYRLARATGGPPSLTGVADDAVLRRRLELQLHESQRLESLGLLAGGIAHDFNNLLTVILGNARLAIAELPEGDPLQQRLARIQAAAEHGAALTEQMMIYTGRGSFLRKPADLASVVEGMLELIRASLPPRAELRHTPGAAAWSEMDETQIRQVVLSLVANAGDALGDDPGWIAIRCGTLHADAAFLADARGAADLAPGEYAFVEVSDSGPGMDAETERRIFEPFFTTRVTGRGLGLAAVLGIVRGHGGGVKLASEPGRGSTFRVLLPGVGRPLVAAPRTPGAPRFEPSGGSARVLLIDDEPGVLEIAAQLLERAGFTVAAAGTGREGLARFREAPDAFAAAVVDLSMPDLAGEAVAAELRALRPELPLVLASGLSAELAASRTLELGAAHFLRKPYAPDALARAVAAVVAERTPASPTASPIVSGEERATKFLEP